MGSAREEVLISAGVRGGDCVADVFQPSFGLRRVFEEFQFPLDVDERIDEKVRDSPLNGAGALGRAGDRQAGEHGSDEVDIAYGVKAILC